MARVRQRRQHGGDGSFPFTPLVVNNGRARSVSCYGARADGFAELNANCSASTTALCVGGRHHRARRTVARLRTALRSRAVRSRVKGILMGLRQVSADEAFTLLGERSQQDDIRIRDSAAQFVTRAAGINPQHVRRAVGRCRAGIPGAPGR